ncbi:MAG: hypothetical protein ACUVV6_07335 [Thermoplasmatota archaeon]
MQPRVLLRFMPRDRPLAERVEESLIRSGFLPHLFSERPGIDGAAWAALDETASRSLACLFLLTAESLRSERLRREMEALSARAPVVPLLSGDARGSDILEGWACVPIDDYTMGHIGALVKREVARWRAARRTGPGAAPEVCHSGPYELATERIVEIPLAAGARDRISGTIFEADGDDFRWCILDERNLRRLEGGAEFHAEASDQGFGSYRILWDPPGPGPWHLVLLSPARRGMRLVSVHLKREGRPRFSGGSGVRRTRHSRPSR